jgi:hypothetical protein
MITEKVSGFTALLFIVLYVVFTPIFTITSLNVLFDLGIDYTLPTWLSALWINVVVSNGIVSDD